MGEDDKIVNGCSPDMMREHEKRITAAEASTSSAHKRMDNIDKLVETVQDVVVQITAMNGNVKVIAEQTKTVMQTLVKHEDRMESMEASMETKETVARLHGKIEELEDMYETDKQNEQDRQLETLDDIKKFVFKIGIGFIAALVLFAVAVIYSMIQGGTV